MSSKEPRITPICPRCGVEGNISQDSHSRLVTCMSCSWVGKEKELWDAWEKKFDKLHRK